MICCQSRLPNTRGARPGGGRGRRGPRGSGARHRGATVACARVTGGRGRTASAGRPRPMRRLPSAGGRGRPTGSWPVASPGLRRRRITGQPAAPSPPRAARPASPAAPRAPRPRRWLHIEEVVAPAPVRHGRRPAPPARRFPAPPAGRRARGRGRRGYRPPASRRSRPRSAGRAAGPESSTPCTAPVCTMLSRPGAKTGVSFALASSFSRGSLVTRAIEGRSITARMRAGQRDEDAGGERGGDEGAGRGVAVEQADRGVPAAHRPEAGTWRDGRGIR